MLGYCCWLVVYIFCVFKQKTAYEMRISDWSSDVCSSDLMDYNLRELGVGDLSVGKKVKQMAQGFYGRATAYESGLAAGEEAELGDALRRNLYGGADPGPEQLALVGGYLRRDAEALRYWPIERLLAGEERFGRLPGGEEHTERKS